METSTATTTTTTSSTCHDNEADRSLLRRTLMDLLIVVVLLVPVIIFEFGIEPFRRGFFCDDETIRYPFHENTVTPVMLGLLVGLLPVLILIATEFTRAYRRGTLSATRLVYGWRTRTWVIACVAQFFYFCAGVLLIVDATEVGKYTMGRLRPHFIAVCQPRMGDGSTCLDAVNQHRYVENYICVADGYAADDVRQARLSFPSGHSSLGCYAMLYVALYLHCRMPVGSTKLARPFLQFCLIMLAWFTALSRVMDNWHHWSDVLVGALIGVIGAWLTARYIAKLFIESHESSIKLGLPRRDTTTTLQEVIATPPPYTLDSGNGFSNEQYCSKL